MPIGHFFKRKPKRIYLDHAAATPVHPEVFNAMRPYFADAFGNPSAMHQEGRTAKRAVEAAREDVARTLRVRATDVTFTASGTEANNLILFGHVRACMREGRRPEDVEIVTTALEHPSVIEPLRRLQNEGCIVHYAPVKEDGRVDVSAFRELLTSKTCLVTIAYANSETGVVEDIGKLARTARAAAKEYGIRIIVHTDASQAPLWRSCALEELHVDALTLDAGKCYGPKGVGVLVHRPNVPLEPVIAGGSQESGSRAGTENTPLIVGCARAIVRAQAAHRERSEKVARLRDTFIDSLMANIEGVILNGSQEHRLANNVNISIPDIDTEFAVVTLDTHGIAASTRSACSGADGGGSRVVGAMTGDTAQANATLRFTLSEDTSRADVDRVVRVLREHVAKMRAFAASLT